MAEFLSPSPLLFLLLILSLPAGLYPHPPEAPFVGVNLGTEASNLLPPTEIAAFLLRQRITHVRLRVPDAAILSALSDTGIIVSLCVPNNQLLALGASNSTAFSWVSRYVLRFHPATLFSSISVGNEVFSSSPSLSPMLLPAMSNLAAAISAAGLQNTIKISTPLSFSLIINPFPPSEAHFNKTLASPYFLPLLRFLTRSSAPLLLNLYPYYVLTQSRGIIPLGSALFKPLPPGKEIIDRNTLLHYTNVFDAMIDAAYFSLQKMNFSGISLLVAETGWPHGGDSSKDPHATRDNAEAYTSNLIRHVMIERAGTPLRPEITPSAYVFELFDEDLPAREAPEGRWGMFSGDGTSNYRLHLEGSGGFLAKDTAEMTFCVAAEEVDQRELQAALDWACGPGKADCAAIQPGEMCFVPRSVREHASYAFDSYYQLQGKVAGSCSFQGAAMVTTTDPSHGRCLFPGSKLAIKGGGSTRVEANTTDWSGGDAAVVMPQLTLLLLLAISPLFQR